MRPALLLALACLLSLSLSACGGGDPVKLTDEGVQALNAGKPAEALAKLDAALAKLEPGTPGWQRATVERLRALANQAPARAAAETGRVSKAHPSALAPQDFEMVANELRGKRAYLEATQVLEIALQQHAESPKLIALRDRIGDEALKAGDDKALDALRGLGYAGDR